MKVAGFTFIRNAVKNDYPIVEAIQSILPLCDEFIVALGNSEDDTESLIKNIDSPKIKIIHTVWDDSIREGGAVFAAETNKAFSAISPDADWAFYIQGDECLHEKYHSLVQIELEENLLDLRIEGLLFKYKHFYGSYDFYGDARQWYRREIRIIRNNKSIHSFRDAQGFRFGGRKLRVKLIDAYIYHYGWVKPPHGLVRKGMNFNLFYNQDAVERVVSDKEEFDYGNSGRLRSFKGSHPEVMKGRIAAINWKFNFDPTKIKSTLSIRQQILQRVYEWTGIRIGEYKNYKRIK